VRGELGRLLGPHPVSRMSSRPGFVAKVSREPGMPSHMNPINESVPLFVEQVKHITTHICEKLLKPLVGVFFRRTVRQIALGAFGE
jgi:hypothetical protein